MIDARALVELSRAVIFDLDGTLVDTLDDLWQSLNSALDHHGLLPVSRDLVLANIHGGLEQTARAALSIYPIDAAEPARTYESHYRMRRHAGSRLYPGVDELLSICRNRGQAVAVCTNKLAGDARELLSLLGVEDCFDTIVGIDTCGAAKPDPAPLRLVLERLNCRSDEAVFIGDSVIDAQCARNAGVRFLLHESGYGATEALGYGCTARFGSYGQLVHQAANALQNSGNGLDLTA